VFQTTHPVFIDLYAIGFYIRVFYPLKIKKKKKTEIAENENGPFASPGLAKPIELWCY
jgi:hypothetical protein